MEPSCLRTACWQEDIPSPKCCDGIGTFHCDCPMAVVFNVLLKNKTTNELVEDSKRFGGLKAWARCVGGEIGTISHQASLSLNDHTLTSLLESIKTQPDGFVIYDLSKTELFSNMLMWNAVVQNSPQQTCKYLFLAMCYSFPQAVDALERCILRSFQRRRRVSRWTIWLAPFTCGISCLIGHCCQEQYTMLNKRLLPPGITITSGCYAGIVLNSEKHFVF